VGLRPIYGSGGVWGGGAVQYDVKCAKAANDPLYFDLRDFARFATFLPRLRAEAA